jgi:hypothetical protein
MDLQRPSVSSGKLSVSWNIKPILCIPSTRPWIRSGTSAEIRRTNSIVLLLLACCIVTVLIKCLFSFCSVIGPSHSGRAAYVYRSVMSVYAYACYVVQCSADSPAVRGVTTLEVSSHASSSVFRALLWLDLSHMRLIWTLGEMKECVSVLVVRLVRKNCDLRA